MSTLVVEVCEVGSVSRHPHADRLAIATVKGWSTVIGYNPVTEKADFSEGDLCIFFPPDSVLPPELANSPFKVCKNKECKYYNKPWVAENGTCVCGSTIEYKDGTPGRTGAMAYCAALPKKEDGSITPGGRVKAQRLRGLVSYGFIMKIDPALGDDPNWVVGQDVKEHFGVTKYEPPISSQDGDTETPSVRFHKYTDIEHAANFPGVIASGEEVVITEKLHGKNCRVGLVLEAGDDGNAAWTYMAGSHDLRRKQYFTGSRRFNAVELVEQGTLTSTDVVVGQIFSTSKSWRVTELIETPPDEENKRVLFKAEEVYKDGAGNYQKQLITSDFWSPLSESFQAMLQDIRDNFPWDEEKFSIIVFGELIGTQDMMYGLSKISFSAFDLCINRKYVDYHKKREIFEKWGIPMVPTLYIGPFSEAELEARTTGPTTYCDPSKVKGKFKGREGVVVTPVKERIDNRMIPTSTNGRVILKSVSADYLDRKGGTDSH